MSRKKQVMSFFKVTGAGNDFVVFNFLRKKGAIQINKKQRARLVRGVCDRHNGVGADGVVFLEPESTCDFRWDFYNSDGSSAEMCGNAARCMAKVFLKIKPDKKEIVFATKAGLIKARANKDRSVSVWMPNTETAAEEKTVFISKSSCRGVYLNTGVPHFVIGLKEKQFLNFKPKAKELRSHKAFGNKGTNVTLIEKTGRRNAKSITFERGVENYTIACGTGATAAALAVFKKEIDAGLEVKISVPGGDLFIRKDQHGQQTVMRGPARIVFEGKIKLGDFI